MERLKGFMKRIDLTVWVMMLLLMLLGYMLIHDVFGGALFEMHRRDSYTLQALAALVINFGSLPFGARYTVDLVAFALFCMAYGGWRLKRREYFTGCFAILFNVYGAVAMRILHGQGLAWFGQVFIIFWT